MYGRLKGVAVGCAALAIASTAVYAAGNWSTLPVVGGASFCVSTVGVNGQAGATGQGGGAAGTSGSYCAQTVPVGPSIVTGTELIPADTGLAGGAPPQTVTLTLGSLNALPLSVTTVLTNANNTLTASNIQGGYILHAASASAISPTTIYLPASPIDGQQFALSSDQTIASLTLTSNASGRTISNNPTALTVSTTAAYGYRLTYNAAANNWYRMQ